MFFNIDRRSFLAASAAGVMGPAALCLTDAQPVNKQPKSNQEITIDLSEKPILMLFSRPSGERGSLRGIVTAIWSNGNVVRCQDVNRPGESLVAGIVDKKEIKAVVQAITSLGVQAEEYKIERVSADAPFDALCISIDETESFLKWSIPSTFEWDGFVVRFFMMRDILERICAKADCKIANETRLAAHGRSFGVRRKWEE